MGKDWSVDFDIKLHDKFRGDVVRLEPYVNKSTTIKFRHKCGNDYYAVPQGVLKSKVGSCTKCRKRNTGCHKKKSNADFKREVKELVGDEYEFLEPYKGANIKILCRHNICGYEWYIKPSHFLSDGIRCKQCARKGRQKLTDEQFKQKLLDKFGGDITTNDSYQGYTHKLNFYHNSCGNHFNSTPGKVLQSTNGGCNKCWHQKGKGRKLNDQFISEVTSKWGDEYTFLDEYIDAKTKIRCRHNICGTVWKVTPMSFSTNVTGGCPLCKDKGKTKSHDDFIQQLHSLVGVEYTISGKYVNNRTKLEFTHVYCGYSWETTPDSFVNGGHRCPQCAKCLKKDTQTFQQEIDALSDSSYEVIGEYKTSHNKIAIRHKECGYVWSVMPYTFINGARCPSCRKVEQSKKQMRSEEDFQREITDIFQNEYLVDHYKGRHKRVNAKHMLCGYEWNPFASQLLAGEGCPRCKESIGERTIRLFLQKDQINFEPQKRFADCKDKRSLPFDFYLPDYRLAIEYDGKQHYREYVYFGGEEAFEVRHKHDLLKNQYCEENNINLLRIPYTIIGDDIGKIIQDKIKELS